MLNLSRYTLSFFAMVPFLAVAQTSPQKMTQGKIIDYKSCGVQPTSFCIDCGTPKAGLVGTSPDAFFHANLPEKSTRKLTGIILVQVQIDTTSQVCSPRIQNFTPSPNEQIQQLGLDQIIPKGHWQFNPEPTPNPRARMGATKLFIKFSFEGRDGYTVEYYRPGLLSR